MSAELMGLIGFICLAAALVGLGATVAYYYWDERRGVAEPYEPSTAELESNYRARRLGAVADATWVN